MNTSATPLQQTHGRFIGKVALVTGAGAGIGRALAIGIAREGAAVACIDINADAAAAVAEEVRELGRRAVGFDCDVSNESQFTTAVEHVVAELGPVDVLLANAGGSRGETRPCLEITADHWHPVLDPKLTTAFLSCLVVGRHMAERRSGNIVVVSSQLAGVVRPQMAPYCSAKGGVAQLIRGAAVDLIEYGIRVNGVAPGPTDTPGTGGLFQRPDVAESTRRTVPIGRVAEPGELVGGALYLASDDASYVVGTTLMVDGGYTIV